MSVHHGPGCIRTPEAGAMLSNQQAIGSIAASGAVFPFAVVQCYHLWNKNEVLVLGVIFRFLDT